MRPRALSIYPTFSRIIHTRTRRVASRRLESPESFPRAVGGKYNARHILPNSLLSFPVTGLISAQDKITPPWEPPGLHSMPESFVGSQWPSTPTNNHPQMAAKGWIKPASRGRANFGAVSGTCAPLLHRQANFIRPAIRPKSSKRLVPMSGRLSRN